MEYCPILVQINHTLLKREYDAEYLLQVWDRQGVKVYQKALKSKIRSESAVFSFAVNSLLIVCF